MYNTHILTRRCYGLTGPGAHFTKKFALKILRNFILLSLKLYQKLSLQNFVHVLTGVVWCAKFCSDLIPWNWIKRGIIPIEFESWGKICWWNLSRMDTKVIWSYDGTFSSRIIFLEHFVIETPALFRSWGSLLTWYFVAPGHLQPLFWHLQVYNQEFSHVRIWPLWNTLN